MKTQKKREHVKGAWWQIVGALVFIGWCAETGRNPGDILNGIFGAGFFLLMGVVFFCAIVAIVGGILGGGGK